jgi:hypothetical protein
MRQSTNRNATPSSRRLFLLVSGLLGLSLGPLLPNTHKSSLAPRVPELSVHFLSVVLLDLTGFDL